MFLKKKKEELSDQQATYQERAAPRWGEPQSLSAGITLSGFEGEGQVGNVSISGCSLHSVTYVNIIPDKVYKAKISPGKEDNLAPFNLNLKLNWTKSSEELFTAGFSVEGTEGTSQLRQYIEILRTRGLKPDYGNMPPSRQ